MDRRTYLSSATLLAASGISMPAMAENLPTLRWRMPSSFPKALDTVFGSASTFVQSVKRLTNGKFIITPHAAGELVPPLAVLDAVQDKTVECGHTAGFYYLGKEPALVFDTGVPFGMTPRQHMSWMIHGDGLKLMRGIYEKFNVVQFPTGNTGAQMGGWFRKEIKSPEDFRGLRIRTPGFLGKVYEKLGATAMALAASEIYTSLEKGTIDAVEWVGPYDDEKIGISKVTKYYYGPGVMELNASLCFIVHKDAWESLPDPYKLAIEASCILASNDMLSKYDNLNIIALKRLSATGIKLSFWPKSVMDAMYDATQSVIQDESRKNDLFDKIYKNWKEFLDNQLLWASINDGAAEQYLMGRLRNK